MIEKIKKAIYKNSDVVLKTTDSIDIYNDKDNKDLNCTISSQRFISIHYIVEHNGKKLGRCYIESGAFEGRIGWVNLDSERLSFE